MLLSVIIYFWNMYYDFQENVASLTDVSIVEQSKICKKDSTLVYG